MKQLHIDIIAAVAFLSGMFASSGSICAQNVPAGAVVYSLPQTTICLKVQAEREDFTPGPYADFAQKYLGNPARTVSETTYRLKSITLAPYVEADPAERYVVNVPDKGTAGASFLQFCSQGLVVLSDSYTGKPSQWRFPSQAGAESFIGKDPGGNLTNATTTLYKTVKTDEGFQKVAVQQSQVIEKSIDRKAEDAARAIFNLRQKRMDIITGDTDATFSGEALQSAVASIDRLEAEYMSLFYGISNISVQETLFDVIPKANASKQMYIAFRISDNQGLLSASNVQGRPIVLELSVEPLSRVSGEARAKSGNVVYYRTPAVANCKVTDGTQLLLESRIPVYQLGEKQSFSLDNLISK